MKLSRTRKTYTREFRLESAQLVVDGGYSISKAAEAMGVGKSTMDGWVKQLRQERFGITADSTPITAEQRKIRELELKLKQLEREKEILKKATALLMSDEMRGLR